MMYLLDTHILIWYFENNAKLPNKAENIIDDPTNIICLSCATLWEISIKIGLGKLDVDFDLLIGQVDKAGFLVIQTKNDYFQEIIKMPQIHKDPFDRLIIATAKVEKMILITADENISKYQI